MGNARRIPISYEERVEARFERGPRNQCWMWDGGTQQGRPSVNMHHVMRDIFEAEFGPIPEGYSLWRADHTDSCKRGQSCRHRLCVNPYHLRLIPRAEGMYERETRWEDDRERALEYKRRHGPKDRRKKNGNSGDQEDQHASDARDRDS